MLAVLRVWVPVDRVSATRRATSTSRARVSASVTAGTTSFTSAHRSPREPGLRSGASRACAGGSAAHHGCRAGISMGTSPSGVFTLTWPPTAASKMETGASTYRSCPPSDKGDADRPRPAPRNRRGRPRGARVSGRGKAKTRAVLDARRHGHVHPLRSREPATRRRRSGRRPERAGPCRRSPGSGRGKPGGPGAPVWSPRLRRWRRSGPRGRSWPLPSQVAQGESRVTDKRRCAPRKASSKEMRRVTSRSSPVWPSSPDGSMADSKSSRKPCAPRAPWRSRTLRRPEAASRERLALHHTAVVGTPPLRIGEHLEGLGDQSEHRSSLGAAGMEVGMELPSPPLIGTTQLRRREPPINTQNRVEVRHNLSPSLSIIHGILA